MSTAEANWKMWDKNRAYGEVLYKRATGELEEMESAKALCNVLSKHYEKGQTLLDVGCGAGHYLRSIRQRVDADIAYTGSDATATYLEFARTAFPDVEFRQGDIFNMPFEDESFDIVTCNNVILHLPPPPVKPLSELIRMARKTVIIRTYFGERNYIVKEVRTADENVDVTRTDEAELYDDNGNVEVFNFFNLYTESYIRAVINRIDPSVKVDIFKDNDWKEFDNRTACGKAATYVTNGMQISGNLVLDARFIVIEK